jgi:hypothetical protein
MAAAVEDGGDGGWKGWWMEEIEDPLEEMDA